MERDQAYELAAQQGFEGHVFHTEFDSGVGQVCQTRIILDDPNTDEVSVWHAEVSHANGCESFSRWNDESEQFFRECLKVNKRTRKQITRKTKSK